MHHSFIDQYSHLESIIHRLDPRVKVIAFFLFIFIVVITPIKAVYAFVVYFSMVLILALLTRIPVVFLLKRSLVIIPFALLIGLFNLFFKPIDVFLNLLIKSWLSVMVMILLSSTTSFPDLLKALEALKMPHILIAILSFMYRYIFTLMDQAMRMERARVLRSYQSLGLRQLKALGAMLGSLFIRTYERGERIYLAMLSRGFDGQTPETNSFAFTFKDAVFLVCFVGVLCITRVLIVRW